MPKRRPIYRVIFQSQAQTYEIYASEIYQSDLHGFIEVEEFLFDERSGVVVDPSEEKLKSEFSGVLRSYIPMHTVIRIDEVEKEGVGKITESGDEVRSNNVSPFPMPPTPSKD